MGEKLDHIETENTKTTYTTTRIRPEDHLFFKVYALKNDTTIVDSISLARELLESQSSSNPSTSLL